MSSIFYGNAEDCLAHVLSISNKVIRSVGASETEEEEEEVESNLIHVWNTYGLSYEVITFVDPSRDDLNPKHLKPRPGRNLMFSTKISAPWMRWIAENNLTGTKVETPIEELVSRLKAYGLSTNAAYYAVSISGLSSTAVDKLIETFSYLDLDFPISESQVVSLWPYLPKAGKVYSVPLPKLLRLIGTNESLKLVQGISSAECFMLMAGLRKALVNQQDKLELVETVFTGIRKKFYKPEAGLQLLLHSFITQARGKACLSKGKTLSLNPLERTLPLLGINL